jgi:AcrR family transcriptional regulator
MAKDGNAGETTRRRILDAAYALFYRHGFVRVSLDAIAREAGVTKRTLYYHYRSKDDLIAAAVELQAELALARIRKWGVTMPEEIGAAIDALFDGVSRWANAPRYEGAGFTRIVMELADLPGHPARGVAKRHKANVEAWLAGELQRRGIPDPKTSARELQLLLEGAMSLALVHGDPSYIRSAAEVAKRIVAAR